MKERITVYVISRPDTPYFHAQWTYPGCTLRRTKSLKTTDEGEAKRLAADLEYELNHGLPGVHGNFGWKQFVDLYEKEKLAHRKPATRIKVLGVLAKFYAKARPKNLPAVNERMLSQYTSHLQFEGRKPVTIQTHLAHLRAAFRWAVRQGLLQKAPLVEAIKVPKKRRFSFCTPSQFVQVLRALPKEKGGWRLLALTAWFTGLRRTELFELRWDETEDGIWLDLEQERLWISAAACKADTDQWVPLHEDFVEVLHKKRASARCSTSPTLRRNSRARSVARCVRPGCPSACTICAAPSAAATPLSCRPRFSSASCATPTSRRRSSITSTSTTR